MKAYSITLFLVIFNVMLSVLTNMQIFTMLSPDPIAPVIFGYDAASITSAAEFLNISVAGLDVVDILGVILMLGQAILNSTFLMPFFLAEFGVPLWFIPVIVLPMAYTYLAAIVQLTTGRILPFFE
jgi:hypothetical protein